MCFSTKNGTMSRGLQTTNECEAPPEKCGLQIQLNDYGSVEVNATPEGDVETYDNSEFRSVAFEYDCGTSVTLTSLPFEGCEFKHWIVNGNPETANPFTLTIDDPENTIEVDPIFELIPPPQYTLTVNTSGDGNGSVAVMPLKQLYDEGEKVTLIAEPDRVCDEFFRWLGEPVDGSTSNIAYITILQNISLTAEFTNNRTCAPPDEYKFPSNVADANTKMKVGEVSRFESTISLNFPVSQDLSYWATLNGFGFMFGKDIEGAHKLYTRLGGSSFNMHDPFSKFYTKITPGDIIARKEVSDNESVTSISGGYMHCDDYISCNGTIKSDKFYSRGSSRRSLTIEDGQIITDASGNKIILSGGYININDGLTSIGAGYVNTNDLQARTSIKTRKVIVTDIGWSDHVFKKNYQLPALYDVENFIKENGRLPGIPSEKEVEENGINIGETQAKLLEKIEEMTLYIIQLEKRIQKMEKNGEK